MNGKPKHRTLDAVLTVRRQHSPAAHVLLITQGAPIHDMQAINSRVVMRLKAIDANNSIPALPAGAILSLELAP